MYIYSNSNLYKKWLDVAGIWKFLCVAFLHNFKPFSSFFFMFLITNPFASMFNIFSITSSFPPAFNIFSIYIQLFVLYLIFLSDMEPNGQPFVSKKKSKSYEYNHIPFKIGKKHFFIFQRIAGGLEIFITRKLE